MGARITDDILATCETCGVSCDTYTNCAHFDCHVRFIQCRTCSSPESYNGCCSVSCTQAFAKEKERRSVLKASNGLASRRTSRMKRVAQQQHRTMFTDTGVPVSSSSSSPSLKSAVISVPPEDDELMKPAGAGASSGVSVMTPPLKDHASAFDAHAAALNDYCERQSQVEPPLLNDLRAATKVAFGQAARMVSGPLQGRLLTMLTQISHARRCLELGAFTGYSALCLAEGIMGEGGEVITCEPDTRAASLARQYFAKSPHGSRIHLKEIKALELMEMLRLQGGAGGDSRPYEADIAFVDADKKAYLAYVQELVGSTIDLTGDEGCSSQGKGLPQTNTEASTFRGVGVGVGRREGRTGDGSRRRPLLRDGALIVVDNTLWKGLVLEKEDDLSHLSPPAEYYGNADRMRRIADVMHTFSTTTNGAIGAPYRCDDGVMRTFTLTPVMLPLRDGLTILRFASLTPSK